MSPLPLHGSRGSSTRASTHSDLPLVLRSQVLTGGDAYGELICASPIGSWGFGGVGRHPIWCGSGVWNNRHFDSCQGIPASDASIDRSYARAEMIMLPNGKGMEAGGKLKWLTPTFVATAADTVGVLPILLAGAMAVQLRAEIGLEVETLGYVFASYFAAAALLAAPVGRLCERTGPALFLRLGTALYIVANVGIATVGSVPILVLFVVVSGIGTAFTRPASSLLVARAVTPSHQGAALRIEKQRHPGAALLAGLAVPSIGLTIGWRWSFAIAAALCLGVFKILPREIPPSDRDASSGHVDMSRFHLVGAAVAVALASNAAVSLGAFTIVTAVDAGILEATAGILIATGSVIGIASRIVVGFWSDRRPGSQLDIVVGMMTIGAAGYGLIAFGPALLLWVAVPVAYATGWAFYGSYYLSIVRLNPVAPGVAIGVAQAGAFAGSIIGPIGLGMLASRISFAAAWLAASIAALGAAAIVLIVEARLRKRPATDHRDP